MFWVDFLLSGGETYCLRDLRNRGDVRVHKGALLAPRFCTKSVWNLPQLLKEPSAGNKQKGLEVVHLCTLSLSDDCPLTVQ